MDYLDINCDCNIFTIDVYGDDSRASMDDYYDISEIEDETFVDPVGLQQNDKMDHDNFDIDKSTIPSHHRVKHQTQKNNNNDQEAAGANNVHLSNNMIKSNGCYCMNQNIIFVLFFIVNFCIIFI